MEPPHPDKVDINFESHPPIREDLDGVTNLLRQTLLQYVDCTTLAKHLIQNSDVTQIIAQDSITEEGSADEEDDDDIPDDNIYGVCSIVSLPIFEKIGDESFSCRNQLLQFIINKSPKLKKFIESVKEEQNFKVGFVVNERYINLPPQLSLPTLNTLTQTIKDLRYTHLVFISKILVKSKNTDIRLPSKRSKSDQSSSKDIEQLIFVNSEEEIMSEEAEYFDDLDVSAQCDENATWSFNKDVKYIPHRRFILIDYQKWPKILKLLSKELE